MDYYELLGVHRSASDAEIKRAYRQLSFQYHPDKNSSPQAEAVFKKINSAYRVLVDPKQIFAYDNRSSFDFSSKENIASVHRDPRYRPKSHSGKSVTKKETLFQQTRKAMRFFAWINGAVIVFASIFILDYFLPYVESTETVTFVDTYNTHVKRLTTSYYYIETSSGKELQILFSAVPDVASGQDINLWCSRILGSLMKVKVPASQVVKIASIYGPIAILLYLAFVLAILGLLFRESSPAFALNASSIGALLAFLYLLFLYLR